MFCFTGVRTEQLVQPIIINATKLTATKNERDTKNYIENICHRFPDL